MIQLNVNEQKYLQRRIADLKWKLAHLAEPQRDSIDVDLNFTMVGGIGSYTDELMGGLNRGDQKPNVPLDRYLRRRLNEAYHITKYFLES